MRINEARKVLREAIIKDQASRFEDLDAGELLEVATCCFRNGVHGVESWSDDDLYKEVDEGELHLDDDNVFEAHKVLSDFMHTHEQVFTVIIIGDELTRAFSVVSHRNLMVLNQDVLRMMLAELEVQVKPTDRIEAVRDTLVMHWEG